MSHPLHTLMPFLHTLLLRGLAAFICLLTGCNTGADLPHTAEHDAAVPTITLQGYRFHAQTFGQANKPALIVLHGGPGADHRYLLGLQALADDYLVLFYDQRGSGLSPRVSSQEISLDSYLTDLDAFVDHIGQGRAVHLLGHSWGAMLASAYTGRHPGKVRRLVLAEPGFLDHASLAHLPQGGWPGWTVAWGMARAWLQQWTVAAEGDPYARRDFLLGAMLPLFQAPNTCDGAVPQVDGWRAGSPAFDATVGRMMSDAAYAASLDFRAGVDRFDGPVLFLAGQCSTTMGEAQQRRHMAHFRQARLVTVAQAGHFLFNEQPKASMKVVRSFLGEPD